MRIFISNRELENTIDTTAEIVRNNEIDIRELAALDAVDFDVDTVLEGVEEAKTEMMKLDPINEGPVHITKTLDGLEIIVDDDMLITYNKHVVKFTSWFIRTSTQIIKIALPAIKVFKTLIDSATADFNKLFGITEEEETKAVEEETESTKNDLFEDLEKEKDHFWKNHAARKKELEDALRAFNSSEEVAEAEAAETEEKEDKENKEESEAE